MKKLLSLLTVLVLVLAMIGSVSAAEVTETQYITYFEDGSCLITIITQSPTRAAGTTSGSVRKAFVNANGDTEWEAVLTGTFSYTGTTATCTNSSVNVTIHNTGEYNLVSKSAGKSGATANGTVTIGQHFLGFTYAQQTYNLSLTCSPTGVLS